MEPNQPSQQYPAPAPANPSPNQYDFINNPTKPVKKSLFSFGGGKTKILVIVLLVLGLLAVLIIVGNLLIGGGGSDRESILTVVKKQNELILFTKEGADNAGGNEALSLAYSTRLAIITQQNSTLRLLQKNGKAVKPKEYAAGISSKATAELATAERNGRFDEVFINLLKEQLTEYQRDLKSANNVLTSQSAKLLIAQSYEDTGLLLSSKPTN